jgi:hypothetical protein
LTLKAYVAPPLAGSRFQITALKTNEERDRKDVSSLDSLLATRRVDFEVTERHTSEIAPGIYLEIDHTNPSFSNVDGWMRVMPADRTFWLRHQSFEEPVMFCATNDGRQDELVLTAVRGNSVKGYLLMPGQPPAGQIASASHVQ